MGRLPVRRLVRSSFVVLATIAATASPPMARADSGPSSQDSTASAALAGDWSGAIQVGPQSLTIVIHLKSSSGSLDGTIDVPPQGLAGWRRNRPRPRSKGPRSGSPPRPGRSSAPCRLEPYLEVSLRRAEVPRRARRFPCWRISSRGGGEAARQVAQNSRTILRPLAEESAIAFMMTWMRYPSSNAAP
jgi:hypothetical protein